MQAHVLVLPVGRFGLGGGHGLGLLDYAGHGFRGGLLEFFVQLAGLVGLDHLGIGNNLRRRGAIGGGSRRGGGFLGFRGRRGDLVLIGRRHRSYFPSFSSSTTS